MLYEGNKLLWLAYLKESSIFPTKVQPEWNTNAMESPCVQFVKWTFQAHDYIITKINGDSTYYWKFQFWIGGVIALGRLLCFKVL